MKNSIVVYTEWLEQIETLALPERGTLFSAIIRYAADKEIPEMDPVTEMAFFFIKAQIDRDAAKYERIIEKRRQAGKARAEQMLAHAESAQHNQHMVAHEGVNVDVNVNEDVNEDVNGDVDVDVNVNDNVSPAAPKKPSKHKHGEYQNVLLTDEELQKLSDEFGISKTEKAIKYLDEYIAEKNYKSKSHYLAIRRWVFDALDRQTTKAAGEYESRLPDWSKY